MGRVTGHQRDAAATAFTFCAFVIWGLQARSNPLPAIELNRSLVLVASLSAGFWSRLLHGRSNGHCLSRRRSTVSCGEQSTDRSAEADLIGVWKPQKAFQHFRRKRRRPCHFTLGSTWSCRELESQCGKNHRIQSGGNRRQAFWIVVPARRAPLWRTRPCAATRYAIRRTQSRRLADQKEQHAILRHRHADRNSW